MEQNASSREYGMGKVQNEVRSQPVAQFGICIFVRMGQYGLREIL